MVCGRLSLEVQFLWLSCMLILLLSRVSDACHEDEMLALQDIRLSLLGMTAGMPPPWAASDDCCSWDGVVCSNDTQRVSHLQLSRLSGAPPENGRCRKGFNSMAFAAFAELQFLNFSRNYAMFQSLDGLVRLSKLRHLDLSYNCLNSSVLEYLGKLVSLEILHLQYTTIAGKFPGSIFENLKGLLELDLSFNGLDGNIPASLFTLPRIKHLNVANNLFEGIIPMISWLNLTSSLRTLNFATNNLSGNFQLQWLTNLRNLEKINLSRNARLVVGVSFPGWRPPFQLKEILLSSCDLDKSIFNEPQFLCTQNHLEVLDLSNNNLSGSMPSWLFSQVPALNYLNLGNNLLTGSIDHICTQTSIIAINLSVNRISGHLPANISSLFPNASFIDFSSNAISGEIPSNFCSISSMEYLDLSNNNFVGELPSCLFTDHPMLKTLKASNNKLGGRILGGKSHVSIKWELYLDGNNFEGELPRYLTANFADGGTIDFHNNKLSGKLDVSQWFLSTVWTLNLADNNLSGELDQSICRLTSIILLDISANNISGSLPNCSNPLALNFLNMSSNLLSGDIAPYGLFNSCTITALDLSRNQFNGSVDWVQHLSGIRYLSLGRNEFDGRISPNLCKLKYVRIIDLSHNRLSGSLSPCIGDLPFEEHQTILYWSLVCGRGFRYPSFSYTSCYEQRGFTFGTKWNRYTYRRDFIDLLSGIDLSSNMLSGQIPLELGHLSHVKALNLSYNSLAGLIPTTFANMSEIESLDLSHNKLSGPVPWQLTQLASLAVFSVAYNDLSGCVPDAGQLSSFDKASYEGNKGLYIAPQGSKCASGPSAPPSEGNGEEAGHDVVNDPVLDAVMDSVSAASFVLAFWITVGFLFCHPYGRRAILKL